MTIKIPDDCGHPDHPDFIVGRRVSLSRLSAALQPLRGAFGDLDSDPLLPKILRLWVIRGRCVLVVVKGKE